MVSVMNFMTQLGIIIIIIIIIIIGRVNTSVCVLYYMKAFYDLPHHMVTYVLHIYLLVSNLY